MVQLYNTYPPQICAILLISLQKKIEKEKINNFESDLIIGIYYLKNNKFDLAREYFKKINSRNSQFLINNFLSESLLNWSNFKSMNFKEAKDDIDKIDQRFSSLKKIQNTFLHCFYDSEKTAIVNALETKKTFGLGYNPSNNYFYVIQNSNLNAGTDFDIGNAEDTSGNGRDKSWLLKFQYESIDTLSYRYNVTLRGTEYVFESFEDVRFYDVSSNRIIDSGTGLAKFDTIELTTLNNKPILEENFEWIDSNATPDGVSDEW